MNHSGLVMLSTGSWYNVKTDDGKMVHCKLRGNFRMKGIKTTNPIVVGDRVTFEYKDNEQIGFITEIENRKNYIIRKSIRLSKVSHIIAANIDKAFLVITQKQPRTSLGFVDRFLTAAEAYRIPVELIFNKADLLSKEELITLEKTQNMYEKIGYSSIITSVITHQGIDELQSQMKGFISLFSGHSGAGKSALLNTIDPELKIRIGEISDAHNKGTHTTTFAQMHELKNGGYIIDSPGIKEFGLINYEKYEISHFFLEMRPFMNQCKYHNCTHIHEPGCAVKEAVKSGEISAVRYKNYMNIVNDEDLEIEYWKLD